MQKPKDDFKKRVYLYILETIKFIENLPKDQTCKIISSQLLRSVTSIGANIIEAKASSSKKDFANFFTYSLKSANETKFWLCILRDTKKADKFISNNLLDETIEISNILAASLLTIKGKKSF